MNSLICRFLVLVVAAATLSAVRWSGAATFNIADGDVAALKNAIITANGNNEDNTIFLAANGNYILTTVENTPHGPSGLPEINYDNGHLLIIAGNATTITRDANAPVFRIFTMSGTLHTRGNVQFDNIVITNGGSPSAINGGGILADAVNLTLNNCTISGNSASLGGGIFASNANVILNNCTLSGNSGGDGGAIWNETVETDYIGSFVTLKSCTLSGNVANYGAGIVCWVDSEGHFTGASLTSCTLNGDDLVAFNSSNDPFNPNGFVTLENCILKDSPLINYGTAGAFLDYGYNLSNGDGGGFLYQPTDQINTDPGLDPLGLQNNGGPTQTIALTYGSLAIDKGKSFGLTTDQRGTTRPYDNPSIPNASGGDGSDIGAYEAPQDPIQGGPFLTVAVYGDHDDGACTGADCSLREAINRANTLSTYGISSSIGFTHNGGAITLSIGELAVTGSVTINSFGNVSISGNSAFRVFSFTAGSSTLNGLTIQDGLEQSNHFFGQTNTGGGIYNSATLSVYGCFFTNNHVVGDSNVGSAGGGKGEGGAIYNSGTLLVDGSVFSQTNEAIGGNGGNGNFRTGSGSGGAGQGGALFNDTAASLTITNSTFNQNMSIGGNGGNGGLYGGNGGNGDGGAIFNLGQMTITSATVNGDSGAGGTGGTGGSNGVAGHGSGGLTTAGGTSTVANTISAGNTGSGAGPDVDGAFTSQGYNLIGISDFSSGFTATGDQVGTTAVPINPQLGPLQYNGGPTETMALLANSPALDKGKSFGLVSDQRGLSRPFDDPSIPNASGGDGSDIGAFELNGTTPATPTPTPSPTATATATPTATATATPTATTTSTPATVSISGTVTYCSNPTLPPVPSVTMTLTGTSSGSTLTNASGAYTFSNLPSGGNYTVTPTKATRPSGSAGINTLDVIAAQRQFLNLGTPLTGCRLTAADVSPVNGDGVVNTLDVIAIQRFFLSQTTGLGRCGKYQFTPTSRSYTGTTTNQTAQNYDALVFGDTAGSPFVHRPEGPSGNEASTDEAPVTVAAIGLPEVVFDRSRSDFSAPVKTSEIEASNKVIGFQGDLTFDERVVTFQDPPVSNAGLTAGNWNVSGNLLPGAGPIRTLRISAYSNDFRPLSGSGTLFTLNMSRVSPVAQGAQLMWAAPPDDFIFIDADLNTQRAGNAAAGHVITK